jgi:hypothetical protein
MHKTSACKRSALYKTEMCRSFEETGYCRYAGKCQFAHDESELRQVNRHPRYKTEVCKTFWELGHCPYGKRCCFIHGATKEQQQQQQQQLQNWSELFSSNWREDEKMPLNSIMLLTPKDSGFFLQESFACFGIGGLGAPGSERRKSFTGSIDGAAYLRGYNSGAGNNLLHTSEDDFVSILEKKLCLLDNKDTNYLIPDSNYTAKQESHFYSPLLAMPVFCTNDFVDTLNATPNKCDSIGFGFNMEKYDFDQEQHQNTCDALSANSEEEQSLLPGCLVESFCL